MKALTLLRRRTATRSRASPAFPSVIVIFLTAFLLIAGCGGVTNVDLKVMKTGLGSGSIASTTPGIACGSDCDESFTSGTSVTLTATEDSDSIFAGWEGDCSGSAASCTVTMNAARSVRAIFDLAMPIPTISDFTPAGLQAYLTANPIVNSAPRFVKALPAEFKQNWILMSRSESLQTGIAQLPRILLPSANAQFVFTVGLATHSSYPGAHPNAIEFMQWDPAQKNFRFHEVVLDSIPALDPDGDGVGVIPARTRGVSVDDIKCSKCHSTRNVLDLDRSVNPPVPGPYPGTTGLPVGSVQAKNKPNWDTYDSWAGMLPFNRDRIYQGSVEAAAFRKIFNLWTWRNNDPVRSIIQQLELQPPGVPAAHVITRTNGGANDGHINFAFDATPPVLTEPTPIGSTTGIMTNYSFDGISGTGSTSPVTRGGDFVTLHHSGTPTSDEGRGVQLFDLLGGADSNLNPQRIADELINYHFATGSVPIDIRPIALAITKFGCLNIDAASNTVTSTTVPLTIDLGFFNARNGMTINDLVTDTRNRAISLPLRKADIQKVELDRTGDIYIIGTENGLIQQYGAFTSAGAVPDLGSLRQEIFRRPIDAPGPDATVMGGIYVDRELYSINTNTVALYRYFLEPLGVSVDKWSMGVRGRSRTYTFADVFGYYLNIIEPELRASLTSNPVPGLTDPNDCSQLITAVNTTLSSLPAANAVPTFTDVQRIFNKSCIECHGGLDYPPYQNFGSFLDLSEDENPPSTSPMLPSPRLARSYQNAFSLTTTNPATSYLYQRITAASENCPSGLMPCGGPALSKADVETIRRWIVGPPSRPATVGDPHITTVEGIHYDFQAAGEFVLLRDEGMELQARQTAVQTESALGPNAYTGLTSCVSLNSAVAVRFGTERVTYQPNSNGELSPQGLELRVNGKLVQLTPNGIPLDNGGRIIPSTAPGGIQIEAPGGGSVVVVTPGWWDYYQLWYLNIDTRHMRATQGVMGAIAPGSWLPALPDGSTVGPRPADLQQRYKELYDLFGGAWRVSDTTSLFDYAPGTSTSTFTIESWPNGESPQSCRFPLETGGVLGKPPLAPLAPEAARQACQGLVDEERRVNCIQDVTVTGEPGFAQTYLRAEQIQLNAEPAIPELVSPADNAEPGKSVRFTWNQVNDADGDPIRYRHCIWSISEDPNNNNCEVVQAEAAEGGRRNVYSILLASIGGLLLILLITRRIEKRRAVLFIITIAILAASIIVYRPDITGGDSTTVSQTVRGLESGQTYYWKVIAEDGKGAAIDSATRRLVVR